MSITVLLLVGCEQKSATGEQSQIVVDPQSISMDAANSFLEFPSLRVYG